MNPTQQRALVIFLGFVTALVIYRLSSLMMVLLMANIILTGILVWQWYVNRNSTTNASTEQKEGAATVDDDEKQRWQAERDALKNEVARGEALFAQAHQNYLAELQQITNGVFVAIESIPALHQALREAAGKLSLFQLQLTMEISSEQRSDVFVACLLLSLRWHQHLKELGITPEMAQQHMSMSSMVGLPAVAPDSSLTQEDEEDGEDVEEQIISLQAIIEQLKGEMEKKDSRISQLVRDHSGVTSAYNDLTGQNQRLEEQNRKGREMEQELRSQIVKLTKRLKEAEEQRDHLQTVVNLRNMQQIESTLPLDAKQTRPIESTVQLALQTEQENAVLRKMLEGFKKLFCNSPLQLGIFFDYVLLALSWSVLNKDGAKVNPEKIRPQELARFVHDEFCMKGSNGGWEKEYQVLMAASQEHFESLQLPSALRGSDSSQELVLMIIAELMGTIRLEQKTPSNGVETIPEQKAAPPLETT